MPCAPLAGAALVIVGGMPAMMIEKFWVALGSMPLDAVTVPL